MSEEKKIPTICNHCHSTDIIFHSWGRSEYYSCLSCKKEVVFVEPYAREFSTNSSTPDLVGGLGIWDPKFYGYGGGNSQNDLKSILPTEEEKQFWLDMFSDTTLSPYDNTLRSLKC